MMGSDKGYTIPKSSSQDVVVQGQEYRLRLLYRRLNQMDFASVRKAIQDHAPSLSSGQLNRLNSVVNKMERQNLFLDPQILVKKVNKIPESLLKQIREEVCLVIVAQSIQRLATPAPHSGDGFLKDIHIALFNRRAPSLDIFDFYMKRDPTLEEEAECIRWIIFGQNQKFMPACIQETRELENKEITLEYKGVETADRSTELERCTSRELLTGDTENSQSSKPLEEN